MSMRTLRFPVAVIMQRTPLVNRWVSERWDPVAVEPEPRAAAAGAPERIDTGVARARWRFRGFELELHPSEAEGFYLNLVAPDPKVFVMWRMSDDDGEPPARPWIVTVSYNQAARMIDGGEQVDSVPMAAEIRAWVEPWVNANYTPEPRRKQRRNDPFADGAANGGRRR